VTVSDNKVMHERREVEYAHTPLWLW